MASTTTIGSGNSRLNYLLGVAVIILLGLLFYIPLIDIAEICWTDDDYSHGLILPFVTLYMWWDQKENILKAISVSTAENTKLANLGYWIMILVGLMLLGLGIASQLSFFSWVAFFPVCIALIGICFGTTVANIFTGPFLLMFMAKPLPDSIVVRIFWPLQVLAARIGALTLELLHVPVYLSGNVIEIPNMKLLVEEACSGMRSVMALLTLSFIMIYFSALNIFGKILIVLSSLLLAIVLNVFRVSLTGVLAHFYDPEAATGFFHTFSGLIVFVVGLPIIFSLASLYSRLSLTKSKS